MTIIRDLAAYGALLPLPDSYVRVKMARMWFLDLVRKTLSLEKDRILLPRDIETRGNTAKNKPNATYDTAKYVLDPSSVFWEHTRKIVQLDPTLLGVVTDYLTDPLQLQREKGAFVLDSSRIKEGDWVVLCQGEIPISHTPVVRRWVESQEDATEGFEDVCLVTGARTTAARLHSILKGIGSKGESAPLISYNVKSACYDSLSKGHNFPVSVQVMKDYTRAGSFLLNGEGHGHLSESTSLIFWPEGQVDHPIISVLSTVFGYFRKTDEVAEVWSRLGSMVDDSTPIHVALLNNHIARISIRGYTTLSASTLKNNLLRFREEFSGRIFRSVASFWYALSKGKPSDKCRHADLYDAAWSVVTGQSYPGSAASLALRDMKYEWLDNNLNLQWVLAYRGRKGELQMVHKDNRETEPAEDDYLNPSFDRRIGYQIGRLVSAYFFVKSEAQGYKASIEVSSELRMAQQSPVSLVSRLSTAKEMYQNTLFRRNRKSSSHLAKFDEVMSHISSLGGPPKRTSQDFQLDVTLGFNDQRRYTSAILTWFKSNAEAKKAFILNHPDTPAEALAEDMNRTFKPGARPITASYISKVRNHPSTEDIDESDNTPVDIATE